MTGKTKKVDKRTLGSRPRAKRMGRVITLRLNDVQYEALTLAAEREETTHSEIARRCIVSLLREELNELGHYEPEDVI